MSLDLSPIFLVWERYSQTLPGGILLRGHSRAAEKSCFMLPHLGLYLDAAIQGPTPPNVICITHSHSDHSCALPMLLTGFDASIVNSTTRSRTSRPQIFVPIESVTLFDNLIQSHFQLTIHRSSFRFTKYNL